MMDWRLENEKAEDEDIVTGERGIFIDFFVRALATS